MSKEQKAHGRMRISSEGGMSGFARLIITVLILAVIGLITFWFAVSFTAGGKELIEDWLAKKLDMKLTVGSTRIGWPYVLVLEDVESEETSELDRPLFKARQIRIGLGLRTRWRVDVHRCSLDLVAGKDGSWKPSVFSRLGNLPGEDLAGISRATAGFRKRIELHVNDSTVRWLDWGNDERASMKELCFSMMPARVPGHQAYWHRLFVYDCSIQGVGSERAYNLEKEWLSWESMDFMALDESGSAGSGEWEKFLASETKEDASEERTKE